MNSHLRSSVSDCACTRGPHFLAPTLNSLHKDANLAGKFITCLINVRNKGSPLQDILSAHLMAECRVEHVAGLRALYPFEVLPFVMTCVYRASYCDVLMTNEMHSSYSQVLLHSLFGCSTCFERI